MNITEIFMVQGMRCASCSSGIERNLNKKDGIINANVNLLMQRLIVEYDSSKINSQEIIRIVESSGFIAQLQQQEEEALNSSDNSQNSGSTNSEDKKELVTLIISLVLAASIMVIAMTIPNTAVIQLLITLTVLSLNKRFFTSGLKSLLNLSPNMDSLVSISAIASLIFSIVMTIKDPQTKQLYYESATMVVALVSLGKYMESKNTRKTKRAITTLLQLTPDFATVITPKGSHKIPVAQIKVGDTVQIIPGGKIPIDGKIISGEAEINEAMLTGESIPVHKAHGEPVIGGTIVINGIILVEVTHVGQDTAISKIIRFVENAQNKKAPIARIADKVAAVFVPVVIAIASISCILWIISGSGLAFAIKIFTAVLVIACPCAMGLATPTAIVVATGSSASKGILIRDAEALQKSSEIDLIVFDKTGTITIGKPEVTDIIGGDEAIATAQILSKFSDHPLSKSICDHAEKLGLAGTSLKMDQLQNFKNTPGKGLEANVGAHQLLVGNSKLMASHNIDISSIKSDVQGFQSEGKTVVIIAAIGKNDTDLGVIALADMIKPETAQAIADLKAMNISTAMLTGDNPKTAQYIAQKAGIDNFYAELLPEQKSQIIETEKAKGKKVMMVGDGINDAPALAVADIGCAVSNASDIAIESADIILTNNNNLAISKTIKISKKTIRIIKENLFWAFFYNVLAIPIAAGALYPSTGLLLSPMIGAIAMSLSSIFVVTNSLRLQKK